MRAAILEVKLNNKSIRGVAQQYGIHRNTLTRYCNKYEELVKSTDQSSVLPSSVSDLPGPIEKTAIITVPEVQPSSEAPVSKSNIANPWVEFGYAKPRQIFECKQEDMLQQYLMKASDIYFGLSPKEVKRFAYTYAVACKINIPKSWTEHEMAGSDWLSAFLKRHPKLSIRSPQATSISRATSFKEHNVDLFF
ncbi:hypothetical protein AVEN_250682-1 [Araneus ventricosus]|uniref:HTH CENPB-type domain-containing protein n=1 Tax=Araneus ventricosus TaxID=182803 RepID=A0A4Y2N441_ARAVE|nr:hypothetical protein AVEN_250682-1 [Araneus ventricosus]